MRVIKEPPKKLYNLRLRETLIKKLDLEAKKHALSRTALIEGILEWAIEQKDLVLRIQK